MKQKKIIFKDNFGNNMEFGNGWNCYGLTLRGEKEKIETLLKNKVLKEYEVAKKTINDEIIEVKFLNNRGEGAYIPIEIASEILVRYPSFKYAVFWEGLDIFEFDVLLYVLYSDSGTNTVTNSYCVTELSQEDGHNPLVRADVTAKNKRKFKYLISDSHNGSRETITVEYAFPFHKEFEKNNYVKCEDDEMVDCIEDEEKKDLSSNKNTLEQNDDSEFQYYDKDFETKFEGNNNYVTYVDVKFEESSISYTYLAPKNKVLSKGDKIKIKSYGEIKSAVVMKGNYETEVKTDYNYKELQVVDE